MNTSRIKIAGVLLVVGLAFGVGVFAGVGERVGNVVFAQTASSSSSSLNVSVINEVSQPKDVDMSQFWQAYNLLQQNFVETHASGTIPTTQDKIYGAIAGLTDSYGDPYTVFFPPAQASIFESQVSGTFAGVGMQMDQDASGNLVVVAPLKDSPAEKAGIQSGDIITSIDATSTVGISVDEAVALIRGPKGTTVTLT
ncbi:MAG TPA: PDZ domain-containing protein, partial [Candidatus Paceibacterota bacterium]